MTEEYLTSHFLVDLVSSFPLELVVPRSFLSRNHVRLVKVLRMHRMRNFGRGGQVRAASLERVALDVWWTQRGVPIVHLPCQTA